MGFFRSFVYAFRGIGYALATQRNMRFHLAAAFYVLLLSRFFSLSAGEYALLMVTIGGVMAAEAVNTAIEALCDAVCPEQNALIGHAKDAAAGAVLVMALFSVGVAIFLFGNIQGFREMYYFYSSHPLHLAALAVSAAVAAVYVFKGLPGKAQSNRSGRSKDRED